MVAHDDEQNGHKLRRVLGPVDATCIVVGGIIGVGIFFTPNRVAQLAGSGDLFLLTWAIGGAIALLGALTFAELGGIYPRSGAQYEALRDAYGAPPAFVFVFCNATAIQTGATAIIAIVCAQNLGIAVGYPLSSLATTVLAAMLIVGLVAANIMGVRWGSRIQNLTVFAKVATLLFVTLLGVLFGSAGLGPDGEDVSRQVTVGLGPFGAIFAALVPTLFAFGGWQHALWIAGEVRQPRRNVPLAIVVGVVVVVIVYMLVNWAYLRLLGFDGVATSRAIATEAVAAVRGGFGERLVAGAVAVSAFGVLNAQLLSGPRLLYAMARDGRFFRIFKDVNARFSTPVPAIVLIGGLALVLLVAAGERGLDRLLTGVVFIDGIFFVLTGAALFVLRYRRPKAERSVRVPGYPIVPALFVVGEIAVVIGATLDPGMRSMAYVAGAWIAAAVVCYLLFFRTSRRT